jgi:hypothetical protein
MLEITQITHVIPPVVNAGQSWEKNSSKAVDDQQS